MSISQANPSQLRPGGDDVPPIIRVGPDRRAEAIQNLVGSGRGDGEHARRFIEYAQSHRIDLDGLWARLDRLGRIDMVALAVPSPGRTAMVFASKAYSNDRLHSLGELIDHVCRRLPAMGVDLAQALLDPAETAELAAFRAGGFLELAMLSYLERPIRPSRSARSAPPQWPAGVSTCVYDESLRDQMIAVLDATYEQTLDCPQLRGHRRTEDIFAGHQASGLFDPSLWTILQVDATACGVLLLNPSSDHQSIELVYLGLARPYRGRGLGVQLLRHGLNLLADRRERTITLAVDEANTPAISLYRREGFEPVLRRRALIRPVRAGDAP